MGPRQNGLSLVSLCGIMFTCVVADWLSGNVMPRDLGPEEYRRMASMIYGTGAESLFFWDTNARSLYQPSWTALRRLGHRAEIEARLENGEPDLGATVDLLRSLSGWNMQAFAPG